MYFKKNGSMKIIITYLMFKVIYHLKFQTSLLYSFKLLACS